MRGDQLEAHSPAFMKTSLKLNHKSKIMYFIRGNHLMTNFKKEIG